MRSADAGKRQADEQDESHTTHFDLQALEP
jgi:hypothetical protein